MFVIQIGKEPQIPTMKDKIMFWKTYHRYIKSEINRMRQVATNNFKTNFIGGKCQLCQNFGQQFSVQHNLT